VWRRAAKGCGLRELLSFVPALVALKDTNLQILDRMERPPNQMRIAAAPATAKRCNKFVILHNKGMLFHISPAPPPRHAAGAATRPPATEREIRGQSRNSRAREPQPRAATLAEHWAADFCFADGGRRQRGAFAGAIG
jgi:hypothetical protein